MAKLNMSIEIATYLKETRLKSNITAKDMAEYIDKSPAYITKLEKGDIQAIDLDVFRSFLSKCFGNDELKITEAIEYIYQTFNASIFASEEEEKSRKEYEDFDKVSRKIPLSNELKQEIFSRIEQSGYNLKQIIDKINQNDDVPDLKNRPDVKPNTWYCSNGVSSILIKLDYDEINNILNSPNSSCNYITIQSILYTINRLNELKPIQAMNEACQTMAQFKFYTISERHKYYGKDDLAAKDDVENREKIRSLLSFLTALSDQNVSVTNMQLGRILNNLKMDIGFTFAFMSLDLGKLENVTRASKKDFLIEVKELIDKYAKKSNIDMFEDIQN